MLVDDVDISNFIMKKLISKVTPENTVYDFTLPEKAFNSLREISPDVIFLDLNMPVLDGWQFLKLMRQNDLHFKVLILTSSTSELDRQRSLAYSNVLDFLIKPVPPTALAGIIQHI